MAKMHLKRCSRASVDQVDAGAAAAMLIPGLLWAEEEGTSRRLRIARQERFLLIERKVQTSQPTPGGARLLLMSSDLA